MATNRKASESERVRAMRERAAAESRDANRYFHNLAKQQKAASKGKK